MSDARFGPACGYVSLAFSLQLKSGILLTPEDGRRLAKQMEIKVNELRADRKQYLENHHPPEGLNQDQNVDHGEAAGQGNEQGDTLLPPGSQGEPGGDGQVQLRKSLTDGKYIIATFFTPWVYNFRTRFRLPDVPQQRRTPGGRGAGGGAGERESAFLRACQNDRTALEREDFFRLSATTDSDANSLSPAA